MKALKWKQTLKRTLASQLFLISVLSVLVALILGMVSTLFLNLRTNQRGIDKHIMEVAQMLAEIDSVGQLCQQGIPVESDLLRAVGEQMEDLDVVLVTDTTGKVLAASAGWEGDTVEIPAMEGSQGVIQQGEMEQGLERCAYAPIFLDGTLVGYAMTGVQRDLMHEMVGSTVLQYVIIGLVALAIGSLLARWMAGIIKQELHGYEPNDFVQLMQRRTEVWDALEEGVLAIDASSRIVYLNAAAAQMLHLSPDKSVVGAPLRKVYPASTLNRILKTGKSEYNVPLLSISDANLLSDRVPLRRDGKVVGAVAIFRNRTELIRMAQDLSGVRHIMEALRANNHEFMNKLHVILGLLQLEEYQQAADYVLELTQSKSQSAAGISRRIAEPSVAALLIGKLSRAEELKVKLRLDTKSHLPQGNHCLSPDQLVMVLGNLIENALDSFRHVAVHALREVEVCIKEDETGLLICVEDTGSGMNETVRQRMFETGFSTKGKGRGTGLGLVKRVVDTHEGSIRVDSAPGRGTTVTIHIPPQQAD